MIPTIAALILATLSAFLLEAPLASPASGQVPDAGQVPAPGQPPAGSHATPLFGLRPGLYGRTTLESNHYQYAVGPGAVMHDTVEVLNFTSALLNLRLYAADLVQSSGGGSAPTQQTDKQRDVGAWIALDQPWAELPPRATRTVGFTVRVPDYAAPGDHLGAVVASTTSEPKAGEVSIESRVALTVRVRIPGVARLDGVVGPLRVSNSVGGRRFTVEVRNRGNVLFTIEGRIDITHDGTTVAAVPVSPKDIYIIPNGVARFQAEWSSTPLFGSRQAVAVFTLRAFHQPDATRRSDGVAMSFFSWVISILAILVLAGAIAGIALRLRRGAGATPPEPQPDTTVDSERVAVSAGYEPSSASSPVPGSTPAGPRTGEW